MKKENRRLSIQVARLKAKLEERNLDNDIPETILDKLEKALEDVSRCGRAAKAAFVDEVVQLLVEDEVTGYKTGRALDPEVSACAQRIAGMLRNKAMFIAKSKVAKHGLESVEERQKLAKRTKSQSKRV